MGELERILENYIDDEDIKSCLSQIKEQNSIEEDYRKCNKSEDDLFEGRYFL